MRFTGKWNEKLKKKKKGNSCCMGSGFVKEFVCTEFIYIYDFNIYPRNVLT